MCVVKTDAIVVVREISILLPDFFNKKQGD